MRKIKSFLLKLKRKILGCSCYCHKVGYKGCSICDDDEDEDEIDKK